MSDESNRVELVLRVAGPEPLIQSYFRQAAAAGIGQIRVSPTLKTPENEKLAWWYVDDSASDLESTEDLVEEFVVRAGEWLATAAFVLPVVGLRVELDCTVWIRESRPVIEIGPAAMRQLAEWDGVLGIETYDERE